MVGVGGLEPPASWSRTKRATNCATPRKLFYYREYLPFCQEGNTYIHPIFALGKYAEHNLCFLAVAPSMGRDI